MREREHARPVVRQENNTVPGRLGSDRAFDVIQNDITYPLRRFELSASHALLGLVFAAISGGLVGLVIGALAIPAL